MAKIKGSGGNDILFGTNRADIILGRGGNDTISGRGGNDKISGDDGDDRIFGGSGNDHIHGGKGNDKIFGGTGNDRIYGGSGNDKVWGEGGDDVIYGGDGNDKIFGGSGNDWIDGGSGNDKIHGGKGDDTIFGGDGNDRIEGGSGNDLVTGGEGADKLTGNSGNDHFIYLANSDSPAGWGWDRITDFTQGHDKIDLAAFRGADDLVWNDGNGAAEFGVWFANSGNSTFVFADTDGDSAADLKIELKHSPGLTLTVDDFIGVSEAPVNNAPVITSNGSGDTAAVSVDENTTAVTTVTATDPDADTLTFSISGGADGALFSINSMTGVLTFNSAPNFESPTDEGLNNVYNVIVRASDGALFDDQAIAVTVTDVIEPLFTENADTVDFNAVVAGTYIAGTQYDALGGDDIVTLPTSSAQAAAAGFDSTQTFHGGAGNDNITAGGSLDNIIDGGTGNDVINGGAGNDTLAGAADQDAVNGSSGDDRITMLVTTGDVDTSDAGSGNDTLLLGGVVPGDGVVVVDLSLTDQVVSIGGVADALVQQGFENLDASGLGSSVNATGSDGANTMVGSKGNDAISGGDGDDTISGGAGDDMLNGGAGLDTAGYANAIGGVTVNLGIPGPQAVGGGQGTDTLTDIENLTGSNFGDNLTGDGNANVLQGLAGNDILNGGAGNDTYRFGLADGMDTISDSGGNDTIIIETNGATLSSLNFARSGASDLVIQFNGQQITVQGQYDGGKVENIQFEGGASFQGYSLADGTPYNLLTATSATGDPSGGPGNDVAVGTSSGESVDGRDGNDLLFGNGENDTVGNFGEVGDDLLVGGDGNDDMNGHTGNDVLLGGDGNDKLVGGEGNDVLIGGAGNDTLWGDREDGTGARGGDIFDYNALSDAGTTGDTISDFQKGVDDLDLHDLLSSFGAPHDMTAFSPGGFLRFHQPGNGNTLVQVDSDGGADAFQTLATLNGVLLGSADTGDFIL